MTRLLVLVALIALTCSVAIADGTDPVFKLAGGGHSKVLKTFTFSFTVDPAQELSCNDGDVCVSLDFINFTHTTIGQLNLNAPAGFTFSCDPNLTVDPYFNNCSPQTATQGPTTISFFGLDATHPGILSAGSVNCDGDNQGDNNDQGDECTANNGSASDFNIQIDLGVKGAITSPFSVQGVLIPAAEPGTLVLVFAAGLGFLALKRSGLAA
jgi:hypothetical protein